VQTVIQDGLIRDDEKWNFDIEGRECMRCREIMQCVYAV